jgi:hypothetical protein
MWSALFRIRARTGGRLNLRGIWAAERRIVDDRARPREVALLQNNKTQNIYCIKAHYRDPLESILQFVALAALCSLLMSARWSREGVHNAAALLLRNCIDSTISLKPLNPTLNPKP